MLAVLYDLLRFGHVLMAIVWVGGAITMQLLATRIQGAGTRAQVYELAGHIESVATRLFIPASLVLLILGIWMVIIGPWNFGMVWIDLAIAMFLYSFISGSLHIGPQMRQTGALAEREGMESDQVAVLVEHIFLVPRIELVFSRLLIVLDMVIKPFL